MKIHSIKFKITLLLVVTVTCLVAMLIGFNSIFSEKVYMNRKQKSMINSYENVNEIMQKYTDSQIDKDTMCADMENISTAKGISVLVVDSSWCTIYVSTQGDDSMMERLRMSIFNGDIFKNNGSPDKAPEPKEQEDDSDNPADKDDKKDHRKRLEDIIDMSGTSLVENRTIISSNDNYTLQKVYDERLGDYYLEIWGTLDNGYSIILRTPIQGIKDNVNISTTLIKYVGGAILAVGIIAAFVVSTYITRPIKQLSNIAEKMSEMDFNASPDGLAQAFIIGEEFIGDDTVAMVLGDNIFAGHGLKKRLKAAVENAESGKGATVFGYYVDDPERFGIVEFNNEGKAVSIEEKPAQPKSNYCVTGLYFYDNKVVEYAKNLKPSARGELEITDLNRIYLEKGTLNVELLGQGFTWLDTGTHESLVEATNFVKTVETHQHRKIACLEEIAYLNGWINKDDVLKVYEVLKKNQYGQYLKDVLDGKYVDKLHE